MAHKAFFSLPNDEEEARKWLDSIKADHSNLLRKSVRICYKHFHKEQLKLDGKYYKVKKGNVFKSAESIENKGVFFSESSIRFSNLPIFREKYSKLS